MARRSSSRSVFALLPALKRAAIDWGWIKWFERLTQERWQEARVKQHYMVGMDLLKNGKPVEAQMRFERTLTDLAFERDIIGNARFSALRKVRGLCIKMLATIAQDQGDKDAAVRLLGDALALDDSDVVMWHNLGMLALDMRRLSVARCAFESGLELRPHHPIFLDKLCEVTYGIGDLDACRLACNMLLALVPAHPRAQVYKGLLLCQHSATEEEGRDLLEDAQDAENALPASEVEQMRNLDRKRPRRESAPAASPRAMALATPTWRCLLESVLHMLLSNPSPNVGPLPAAGTDASRLILDNQLCVVSVDQQPEAQPDKGQAGGRAGDHDGGAVRHTEEPLEEIHDDTTRDGDMEEDGKMGGGMEDDEDEDEDHGMKYETDNALCMVCGGDVDPGDYPGDDLLLCDNFEKCGQSYHTTCLCPPLKHAPGSNEEWVCFKCDPRPQSVRLGLPFAASPSASGATISAVPQSDVCSDAPVPGGDGGEEASPSKRTGGRKKSNSSVSSAPSRKSRRQSQVLPRNSLKHQSMRCVL